MSTRKKRKLAQGGSLNKNESDIFGDIKVYRFIDKTEANNVTQPSFMKGGSSQSYSPNYDSSSFTSKGDLTLSATESRINRQLQWITYLSDLLTDNLMTTIGKR
jgi:hypothetical protein